MPDNKQVLDPGWRALDANGEPYSGAKLKVFQAGTTTPRTVYSDDDLSSSLGSVITCDSGGYPTSDGNAKTLVYTGVNAFKLQLYTSADVLVWEHDDIPGALDTSTFGGDTRITSPVSSVSTDQVLAKSDSGKLYNVNCSGGSVSLTLGSAATLEDSWRVGIRHNGSANQVKIVTTGGELIALPNLISTTAFALTSRGQEIWIRCDGAGFTVGEVAPPLLNTTGVIGITNILSAPPVSPVAGVRYLVGPTPTGDWSTFTEHDIAESNGQGGWIRYTPPTNCGWVAYNQNTGRAYRFVASAWVIDTATNSVQGGVKISNQTDMETATATDKAVMIGHQHFHPKHPKAWGALNMNGTLAAGAGCSSGADGATGASSVAFTDTFSSANISVPCVSYHAGAVSITRLTSKSTTAAGFTTTNLSSGAVDPDQVHFAAFGDI